MYNARDYDCESCWLCMILRCILETIMLIVFHLFLYFFLSSIMFVAFMNHCMHVFVVNYVHITHT